MAFNSLLLLRLSLRFEFIFWMTITEAVTELPFYTKNMISTPTAKGILKASVFKISFICGDALWLFPASKRYLYCPGKACRMECLRLF